MTDPTSVSSKSVSVVINTYNRAESLRHTLEGLGRLEHPNFEVVVVNGPSTDGTAAVLADYRGLVKLVNTQERNLSLSRNLGIAASAGEIVAFIDDDAYPDPAWLDHLTAAYENPEVGAAGGPTLDHTGARWQARYSLADRRGHAWVSDGPNPTQLFGSPWSETFVYTIGTNSSFRRSALVAIGGFDEEYEFYLDETDVCLRLTDRGWLVAALDEGIVHHRFLPSDIRTDRRAVRHRYSVIKNRAYFALRHGKLRHSVAELLRDADEFVTWHRNDLLWNIEQGLLDTEDLERFERDAPRAMDVAVARGLSGAPRTRPRAWFDAQPGPFVPFPTLRAPGGPLHLVFLSRDYPPGPVNGIGRFVHSLAAGLAGRGHIVHVVTESETHARVDVEDGVWVHRVPAPPSAAPPGVDLPPRIWGFAAAAAAELAVIDRRRPVDVVQYPAWDVEGAAIAREGGYRTVVSLHTPLLKVVELDATFPASHPEIVQIIAEERSLYRSATAVLANGQSVVDDVERLYGVDLDPAALAVVPHGLPSAPNTGGRVEAGGQGFRVLFVGRLEHRKGIDVLLAAVPELVAQVPAIELAVVGDDTIAGPDGRTYRQHFEAEGRHLDRVTFTGRVGDEELHRWYDWCDVLVAPSRYESFGLILLEAMRHGKPVVAGDNPGMRAVVDGAGVLVDPEDSAALATALTALAGDPVHRDALGAAALELFEDRYSVDEMVSGAERLYRAVAADEVGELPSTGRPLGLDLRPLARCPDCRGHVETWPATLTADGLVKRGEVVCRACQQAVGRIDQFIWDFHHRSAVPARVDEPLTVSTLGERRFSADDLARQAPPGWFRHDRFLVADGPAEALRVEVHGTDLSVRLLQHAYSGVVELVVDGGPPRLVDLHLGEGALVAAVPLIVDAPFGRHVVEIRPTGRGNAEARGSQVLVEELVAFGPSQRGLGFGPAEAINRGNPVSPHIERHLATFPRDAWILECGGGDRRSDRPHQVNFEYLRFELADVLGDIHHLPFADGSFDAVFSQAVFEHVRNPFEAAAELVRVTKPGGLILTEVAFLQPLHAVPYHYFNMTQWGAEELFSDCEIVESDWFGDLSTSVDWFLRTANLDGRAPSKTLASVRAGLAELDRYITHDDLRPVAAGVFVVARKPDAS